MVAHEPRLGACAIYSMYAGVKADADPTANPRIIRATTIDTKPAAVIDNPEPIKNKIEANNKRRLRPNLSDNEPIDSAPIDEPISTDDVMKPVCSTFRLKSLSINDDAPEIIPVSNPNNNPPNAPKTNIKTILKCRVCIKSLLTLVPLQLTNEALL